MSTRTVPICFLAGAIAIPASAQPAPPPPPASGAESVPPAESSQVRPAALGPTRLFLAPTARTPKRGDGTLALTEIAFPWGEVGLADRVSVRIFAFPPLGDVASAGVAIEPKVQLYGGARFQAAVGVVQLLSSTEGESGGIGYGVATVGGADTAVTVGYGYGYGGVVDSEGSRGVLWIGAERAVGRHFRLIAEAYLGGAAFGLPDRTLLGGARFSRGRFSADLAAVVPFYETGSGTPGPLLTLGWAF